AQIELVERQLRTGSLDAAFRRAKEKLWMIDLYFGFMLGQFPETSALYQRLHSPPLLLNPDGLKEAVLQGVNADTLSDKIAGQVAKLKQEASRLSRLELLPAAGTPLDQKIAELQLFKQTRPADAAGARK